MPQPYLAGPASLSRMLLAKYPSGDRRPDQTSSGMVEPGTKAAAPGRGARGFRRQRHGPAHTGAVPGGSGTANAFSRNEIIV
jgi:hypothetical protein